MDGKKPIKLVRKQCDQCQLVIEGVVESQVNYNMELHKVHKHSTKIKKDGTRR